MYQQLIIFRLLLLFVYCISTQAAIARSENHVEVLENKYAQKYQEILRKEKKTTSERSYVENLASGLAATIIGFYGYYFDERGLMTKVTYSLTQTAGIILTSDAIYQRSKPSFILLADRHLRNRGALDYEKYQIGVVKIQEQESLATTKNVAVTAGILAGLYAYNGYREKELVNLKNAFYFLSFNFALISGISTYKFFTDRPAKANKDSYSLELLPNLQWTYHF